MRILILCLIALLCVAFALCVFNSNNTVHTVERFVAGDDHLSATRTATQHNNNNTYETQTDTNTQDAPQSNSSNTSNTSTENSALSSSTMTEQQASFLNNTYINILRMNSKQRPINTPIDKPQSGETPLFGYFVTQNSPLKPLNATYKSPKEVVEIILNGAMGSTAPQQLYVQAIPTENWIALRSENKSTLQNKLTKRLTLQTTVSDTLRIVCCKVNPGLNDECTSYGTNKDYQCSQPSKPASWAQNGNLLNDGVFGDGVWNQENPAITNKQMMQGNNMWSRPANFYTLHSVSDVVNNIYNLTSQCSSSCHFWVQIGKMPPVEVVEKNRSKIKKNVQNARNNNVLEGVTFCCTNPGANVKDLYVKETPEMTCLPNVCTTNLDTIPAQDESSITDDSDVSTSVSPNMNYSPYTDANFGPVSPSSNFWSSGSENVQPSPENIYGSGSSETQSILEGSPLSTVGSNTVLNNSNSNMNSNMKNILNPRMMTDISQAQVLGENQPNMVYTNQNGAVVLPNQSGVFAPTDPSNTIYANARPNNALLQNQLSQLHSQMHTQSIPFIPNSMANVTQEPDMVIQHVHVLGNNTCNSNVL